MRFGLCTGMEHGETAAEAGFDYLELPACTTLVPDEDEASWRTRLSVIRKLPLPVETFNLFLRGVRVTGPDIDQAAQRAYIDAAARRAVEAGASIMVFGSGSLRNVPDGFSHRVAEAQMEEFLGFCGDAHARHALTFAVEPLRRQETNLVNLYSEAAAMCRRVGRAGVECLADTYHMAQEGEPLQAVEAGSDLLAHVHTSEEDRTPPGMAGCSFEEIFRVLRRCGYSGRVSIECTWPDGVAAGARAACARLRTAAATG